ncbi:J domain-containing protein [Chroococcidiopsis sp. CCNUC1]|nr:MULTISPECIES: J domain-containing protein [Chroococcidiopsis]URD50355.1 J domain-containing protein [Chroococcidiopsis sp. CCNUC1]
MTQHWGMPNNSDRPMSDRVSDRMTDQATHYTLLGLHPSASPIEIRRAYRHLSKLYHPDTTDLPSAIATVKFQQLNEAYATLSNPERRTNYDLHIGYSRLYVIQPPPDFQRAAARQDERRSSAYLDPTDRPLSSGEVFVLFILGLTFIGCILLAIAIATIRGDTLQTPVPPAQLSIVSVEMLHVTSVQSYQ